jgi:hypothetical protein
MNSKTGQKPDLVAHVLFKRIQPFLHVVNLQKHKA